MIILRDHFNWQDRQFILNNMDRYSLPYQTEEKEIVRIDGMSRPYKVAIINYADFDKLLIAIHKKWEETRNQNTRTCYQTMKRLKARFDKENKDKNEISNV